MWISHFIIGSIFLFPRIAFLALAFLAITARAGFVESITDEIAYTALEGIIIASGESKAYADCFINMLKMTGASKDVTDFRMLRDKFRLADIVCQTGGPFIWFGVIAILIILCCCCCCFSSKRRQSAPKPLIVLQGGPGNPYGKINKV